MKSEIVVTSKRSVYLDVIKGIAIILVVLAHSVQWGSGRDFQEQGLFFSDPLFKVIYGFHMPLFMVVSGYLFHGTLKRHSASDVLRSRLRMLLLPIATWQTLYLAILLIAGEIVLSASLLYTYKGALWFLWSVLFCSVMVLVGHKWFRDSWLYYVVVGVALLLVPGKWLDGLHVFMFPYFVGGYLWNASAGERWYKGMCSCGAGMSHLLIAGVAIAIYIILYYVYDTPDHSIYRNGTCLLGRESLWEQAAIDAARYVYGWAGVVAVMVIVWGWTQHDGRTRHVASLQGGVRQDGRTRHVASLQGGVRQDGRTRHVASLQGGVRQDGRTRHVASLRGWVAQLLTYLGRNTLGIYIVNYFTVMLMPLAVTPWMASLASRPLPHIVLALVETAIMIAVALAVVRLIRCCKTLRLLMLGEK